MTVNVIKYPLKAIGVTNNAERTWDKRTFGLQFYDFDGKPNKEQRSLILGIFENDCLCFKTKHGFHYVSFALTDKFRTIWYARELSKQLGQDFNTHGPSLILRIGPKKEGKTGVSISAKPKFVRAYKKPSKANRFDISLTHMNLYFRNIGFPLELYQAYFFNCGMFECKAEINNYNTRD